MKAEDIDRIIAMAYEDRTLFEAINSVCISNDEVVELMRKNLKLSSWEL